MVKNSKLESYSYSDVLQLKAYLAALPSTSSEKHITLLLSLASSNYSEGLKGVEETLNVVDTLMDANAKLEVTVLVDDSAGFCRPSQ